MKGALHQYHRARVGVHVCADLGVQLHDADVVVDDGAVVARVHDDGTHAAAVAVDARVVQVVQAHHHLPQVGALPPSTHTNTAQPQRAGAAPACVLHPPHPSKQ